MASWWQSCNTAFLKRGSTTVVEWGSKICSSFASADGSRKPSTMKTGKRTGSLIIFRTVKHTPSVFHSDHPNSFKPPISSALMMMMMMMMMHDNTEAYVWWNSRYFKSSTRRTLSPDLDHLSERYIWSPHQNHHRRRYTESLVQIIAYSCASGYQKSEHYLKPRFSEGFFITSKKALTFLDGGGLDYPPEIRLDAAGLENKLNGPNIPAR